MAVLDAAAAEFAKLEGVVAADALLAAPLPPQAARQPHSKQARDVAPIDLECCFMIQRYLREF
jgi:hypothetical protein